jgi:2-keto-4-pentenoate hydratase/2-oxohepta-3-ene-1,7-dioic acid hydratase in catechol pathway
MKIICIGHNYREHAKELNTPIPVEPVFFMKPDSSILLDNKPFYLPDFSKEIHHEVEVLVKINRLGKNIERRFAHRYYNEITVGIDFTARDLQRKCKAEGKPWEISKAFDGSAVIGKFIKLNDKININALDFRLLLNGVKVQEGNTSDMIFSIDQIIEYVSKFITLKIGDVIYTGTPKGVGSVKINDRLEAYIGDMKLLDLEVK